MDNRKTIAIAKKDIQQRLISGWISTEKCDMWGDVVIAKGFDFSYYDRENIRTLTLFHDPTKPCGRCKSYKVVEGRGVYMTFRLGQKSMWGREAIAMVDDDILNSLSIEWDPSKLISSPPTADEREAYGDDCKRVMRETLLTNVSLVPMPMQPEAGLTEKALNRLMNLVNEGVVSRKTAKMIGDVPEKKVFVMNLPKPVVLLPGIGLAMTP